MFGSKEKKEAKKAAKKEKKEAKQAAKEEKQAEEDKLDIFGNFKDGFGRDGITKQQFVEFLQANWQKDSEEFENAEFVKFVYDWYDSNAPKKLMGKGNKPLAEEIQYKEEIDAEKLFKWFTNRKGDMDNEDWLREFNPETEVVLLHGETGTITQHGKIMLTNCRFYRNGYPSRKGGDVTRVNDALPLKYFKGNFEIKGMLGDTDFRLDDDPIIKFNIEDKTDQRRIQEFFTNFIRRNEEFFPAISATQIQPTAPSAPDPLEQIKKLKELQDSGVITEEEFEEKKKELMDKI